MQKAILTTAVVLAGLAGTMLPAAAAAPGHAPMTASQGTARLAWNQGLDPRQIRRALAWQGYRHIEVLDRRNRVYLVKAEGRSGHRYLLVVDSRTARVLDRRRIGHRHEPDHDHGPGWNSGGGGPAYGGPPGDGWDPG